MELRFINKVLIAAIIICVSLFAAIIFVPKETHSSVNPGVVGTAYLTPREPAAVPGTYPVSPIGAMLQGNSNRN